MCFLLTALYRGKKDSTAKSKCKLCSRHLSLVRPSANYPLLICNDCAVSERRRLLSNNKRRRNRRRPTGRVYMSDWMECLAEHNFSCAVCQKRGRKNLTLDHIKSLGAGGTNTINNIQPLCKRCHEIKDGHKRKPLRHFKRLYRKLRYFLMQLFNQNRQMH